MTEKQPIVPSHLVLCLQYKPHSQSEKKPESLAKSGRKESWQQGVWVTLFGTWQGFLLGMLHCPASLTRYLILDQDYREAPGDLLRGKIIENTDCVNSKAKTHLVRSSRGGSSLASAAAHCDLLPTSTVPTCEFQSNYKVAFIDFV